ncbi:hypothetical protein Hypma_010256 [Hypsizygus marmoreus]|uniref:Uncharacterized protein n=1 Tax=Hypsizygus marmoreus TaxID=39966 RepID=A0A369JSV7_HYPMA|nr:hypothetical protein Hypma_010256 [Hypsizygus marmoreus]
MFIGSDFMDTIPSQNLTRHVDPNAPFTPPPHRLYYHPSGPTIHEVLVAPVSAYHYLLLYTHQEKCTL